jgi:plastocyanin
MLTMPRFRLNGLLWMLLAFANPLVAATVTVHVTDQQGHAVSDAVVTLVPDAAPASAPSKQASQTYYVDQKHETFIPYVRIFRPGDRVIFRNSDTTRHQVYSFAAIKQFEFVLRPGDSSPPLVLDKAGIVAVGCNIHDDMVTYLFVSSTPAIGITDQAGDVVIDKLAAGRYSARLWHPQLQPGKPLPGQQVSVGGNSVTQQLVFTVSLMADPRRPMPDHRPEY